MVQNADLSRPCKAVLTIDETTVHVTAPAGRAGELFAWFRDSGIECDWRRGAGAGGLDLIDFGNPSAADEARIRRAFLQWQKRNP